MSPQPGEARTRPGSPPRTISLMTSAPPPARAHRPRRRPLREGLPKVPLAELAPDDPADPGCVLGVFILPPVRGRRYPEDTDARRASMTIALDHRDAACLRIPFMATTTVPWAVMAGAGAMCILASSMTSSSYRWAKLGGQVRSRVRYFRRGAAGRSRFRPDARSDCGFFAPSFLLSALHGLALRMIAIGAGLRPFLAYRHSGSWAGLLRDDR